MNVLLVCAAGMSTSLLVNNMRKYAGAEDTITAIPFSELDESLDGYDVVLLGPQIRFRLAEVEEKAGKVGKPVGVVDMRTYGMMDGATVFSQAKALLAG